MLKLLPHKPGYTLSTDGFMEDSQLVGFHLATQAHVFTHFHDFYELALVIQGTGIHVTDAGEARIGRGTVIFVPPGAGHGFRAGVRHGAKAGEGLLVLNCILRLEATEFDLPWLRRDRRLGRLFGPAGNEPRAPLIWSLDEGELVACLGHLDAIRERPAEERNEAFDLGHLLLALDVLLRHGEPERRLPVPLDPEVPALVVSAVALFDQDLAARWTLSDLADRLCVGRFHLVRQFDRSVGLPPMAYLNRLRAERAAVLLATTEEPIGAVGAAVGWPDPSQFSRRFRQHLDTSPRAYRDQSRAHLRSRRPATAATQEVVAQS